MKNYILFFYINVVTYPCPKLCAGSATVICIGKICPKTPPYPWMYGYLKGWIILNKAIVNSLAPGRFKINFRWGIFQLILVVNGWGISCETTLIWVSLDHTYDKSTLVQVMAWCRQATSHYLNQCWPRSPTPYGVTRPQWVNTWRRL